MFAKFSRSYAELLSTFDAMSCQEYTSKGITNPVFLGDQAYKLERAKGEANFVVILVPSDSFCLLTQARFQMGGAQLL